EEEEEIAEAPPIDVKKAGEELAAALDQTAFVEMGEEDSSETLIGQAEKQAAREEEPWDEPEIALLPSTEDESSEWEVELAEEAVLAPSLDVHKAGAKIADALDQTEFFELDSKGFDTTLIGEAEKKAQEKTAEQPSSIVAMVPVETEPVEELSFFEIEFGSTKETSRKEARLAAAEKKAESLEVFELNEDPVESALASLVSEEGEEPVAAEPPVDLEKAGEKIATALEQTQFLEMGEQNFNETLIGQGEKRAAREEEPWDEPQIALLPTEEESDEWEVKLEEEIAVAPSIDVEKAGAEIADTLDQTEFFELDDENEEKTLIGQAEEKAAIVQETEVEIVQEPLAEQEKTFEIEFGSDREELAIDEEIDFLEKETFEVEEMITATPVIEEPPPEVELAEDDSLEFEFSHEEESLLAAKERALEKKEEGLTKQASEEVAAAIQQTHFVDSEHAHEETLIGQAEHKAQEQLTKAISKEASDKIATAVDQLEFFELTEQGREETLIGQAEKKVEALAQATPPYAKDDTEKQSCIDADPNQMRPIISNLKGLVLIDSSDHLLDADELKGIEGFCVRGLDIPSSKGLQEKLDPIYLNQPLDLGKINSIKQAIHEYYQAQHNPFILVAVPKQCISYNVLQLVVIKAKVGDIRVEGNRWFSDKTLTQYVKAKPGQGINVDTLQTDLNFINRNPFRRVNIVYAPGKETGTTDLVLAAEDRPPYRFYMGADDTGLLSTGRERLFGGFTWGKAFGLDHILSYQYTASYNLKSFQSHTLQYMALLPWKHMLNFYGGYSTVHSNLPFPGSTNLGVSGQLSGRYSMPFHTTPRFSDEYSVGFDYKGTNNSIQYSELYSTITKEVNLTQLVFEYRLHKEWNTCRIEMNDENFASLFTFLANQSLADYQTLRPNATTRWYYNRGSIRYIQRLPHDFSLTIWARGQFAFGVLLPSEQLGIGGHDTVRGYEERQLNMDNGLISNIEIRTPPISLISGFRKHPVKDSVQLLAFIDYGVGTNNNLLPGEPNYDYLFSTGPGIRYTLDPYISARLDWGIKLHNSAIFQGGWSMIHFSGTVSY
ncbi:MAG: hypothetical protein KGJ02_07410, partial [Verrucomicrobiota bacterium]|nr:hypothetical protein [Verrucomicrobiota bacterium]